MKYRYLRITWTVFCGIALVLLIALWVRSYWRSDFVQYSPYPSISAGSVNGRFSLNFFSIEVAAGIKSGWGYNSFSTSQLPPKTRDGPSWVWYSGNYATFVAFPIWAVVLPVAGSSVLPWMITPPRSFSLRTLLIATTLVAVVLGLIVWSLR